MRLVYFKWKRSDSRRVGRVVSLPYVLPDTEGIAEIVVATRAVMAGRNASLRDVATETKLDYARLRRMLLGESAPTVEQLRRLVEWCETDWMVGTQQPKIEET